MVNGSAALLPGLTSGPGRTGALDRPDALVVDGRCLSDADLQEATAALAVELAGAPIAAVDATSSLETVVAVVAALRAGVPVVPVPPDAGPHERRHVLSDSGAAVLLVAPERLSEMEAPDARTDIPCMPVDVSARHHGSPLPRPVGMTEEAPAMILYTSGTTGAPKGVVTRRDAIAFDLDALAEAWGWTGSDTIVHGLPLYHVHGLVLGVLGPIRHGGRLIHTGRPTPEAYADAVVNGGGTLCFGVPTIWGRVGRSTAAAGLRRARLLVSGSAPLPAPVFEAVQDRCGHRLLERYGMTETLITLSARAGGTRRAGTVGEALPGMEARVVGDDRRPVSADGRSIGSLEVSGPSLMDGYLGRPEETAASFMDDEWFATGDVAIVDPDGMHRIVGRASTDLIKTGGFRVGAGEIETALLDHPAVREVAVVGEPDDELGQVVVAYVVSDGTLGHPEALADWARQRLSAHKCPRRVVNIASLPRNALGKVQKAQLPRA